MGIPRSFSRFSARWRPGAGNHDAGRSLLRHIIDVDTERCTLPDDAQFFIGDSYSLQRDPKVREAFGME